MYRAYFEGGDDGHTFAGVYGRITDLGSVTQRDYNLAVTVAMMKDMDSVVVDSSETAHQCVQYLKDHRIASLVFLPLTGLKRKPLDEGLRDLGGSAKLVIDLLEFDNEYMPAFLAACGNIVACSSIEEALQLSEQRPVSQMLGSGTLPFSYIVGNSLEITFD